MEIPLLVQGGVARSAGVVCVADSMTHLGSLYLSGSILLEFEDLMEFIVHFPFIQPVAKKKPLT